MKVVITMDVSTATAGDIAITAAEGGIGYWCIIDSYDWKRWSDGYWSVEVAEDFVFYTIQDDPFGDGTYRGWPIHITPKLIARGIGLYLNGVTDPPPGASSFEGRQFDDSDLCYMDSEEADCVIQLGAFGGLVYG